MTLVLSVLCTSAAQAGTVGQTDPATLRVPLYTVEGDTFVRHNGDSFNNRPLYCNQNSAIVDTGDRPLIRLGDGAAIAGTLMIALARGNTAKWLHEWSDSTSKYRPDRMEWILKDDAFGATALKLEVVPAPSGGGLAAHLQIAGAQPGDRLIWAYGGATRVKTKTVLWQWDVTTVGREDALKRKFVPGDCSGNQLTVDGQKFMLKLTPKGTALASCSITSTLTAADATAWADPLKFLTSSGGNKPLGCGVVNLDGTPDIYWTIQVGTTAPTPGPESFAAALKRVVDIENRVVIDTPDANFNAMVAASNTVMDGVFRDGMFTHSGMRWGVPLLGWRTTFGGTAYGWHDRVLTEAVKCIGHQVTSSDKTEAKADAGRGLSSQAGSSRFFGKGRVNSFQPPHYDMQSQFFDQIIYAWRATADPALEKILRPALELHTEYLHDCFDPDDDGLYESYATSWPTDDQWYNGSGTAEETAYAYNAEKAVLEMARRAGDAASVTLHEARVAKIEKSFMDKLWIPEKGYVAASIEQGGHQRRHDDCWLYSIFCPIDAGMLTTEQAAQSLYYTEWGLERDDMPYGGQRCWPSNWVPSVWSLREMWPGDNYQLALAYFQTGLPDEGWNLLRGTYPCNAFYGPVPADFGYPNGSTDFTDCASMFCRTVVDGMFGYRPNYPDGVVTFAPQLPSAWDHASIKTPDVSIEIKGTTFHIRLAKAAKLDLRLPVRAGKVTAATVNGQPCKWELLPGYGCSVVKIAVPETQEAKIELTCAQPLPPYPAVALETALGQKVDFTAKDADKVLQPAALPAVAGYHLVESLVQVGDAPQKRLFKVKVNDPQGDAAEAGRHFDKAPADARWQPVDLSAQLNGDIRQLFLQQYLSPRPNTCSLRLATDGYSTWQMVLDPKHKAPTIDLANVPKLRNGAELRTPQGVPFAWGDGANNVALTSMWDNWPRQVTVPVNGKADGLWLLLCGFTNPMQGRIANAEIRLEYGDGVVEKTEVVPPLNFWSLCPYGDADYNYQRDGFSLPKVPPATVQLGNNCRAILLNQRLRPGVALKSITLETLSQEVMIGLMGASLMNPH